MRGPCLGALAILTFSWFCVSSWAALKKLDRLVPLQQIVSPCSRGGHGH
jgi:hypothetical protein